MRLTSDVSNARSQSLTVLGAHDVINAAQAGVGIRREIDARNVARKSHKLANELLSQSSYANNLHQGSGANNRYVLVSRESRSQCS
jgi:hypothetical protein